MFIVRSPVELVAKYSTLKVLKNGVEVKLQRNALSVLEAPTGDEDDDYDFDDSSSGSEVGEKDNHHFRKLSLCGPFLHV